MPQAPFAGRTLVVTVVAACALASTADARQLPCVNPPPAPAGLSASAEGLLASVRWSASPGPVDRYELRVGSSAGQRNLAAYPVGMATQVSGAITAGVTYYLAVVAINSCGTSGESNEAVLTASGGGCSGRPAAPTGFANSVAGSLVTFSWQAVAGAMRYRLRAGASPGDRSLVTLDVTGVGITVSAPNGTYYVALQALNDCGASDDSNETTVRVGQASPSGFQIDMPLAAADAGTEAFGLNPFGIHFGGSGAGGHGLDGHPGWDIEYRIGGTVRAAAAGVIQSLFVDPSAPATTTVQIMHQAGGNTFRTVYTNVTNIGAAIRPGAAISAGQAIGIAGSYTQTIGSQQVTYAMTHFQTDDFRRNEGLTNPNAVNPEEFLSASGRALFDSIWTTAAYNVEITEPFPGNPRLTVPPFTRTWIREAGGLAARIDFTRREAGSNAHDYALYDAGGNVTERGTASMQVSRGRATLDLQPSGGGPPRLARLDILSETMRLDYAAPGASRPGDLANASVYRTSR